MRWSQAEKEERIKLKHTEKRGDTESWNESFPSGGSFGTQMCSEGKLNRRQQLQHQLSFHQVLTHLN